MRLRKVPFQYIQILINLGCIVTGMCTSLPLGSVSNCFLGQCILYTSAVVRLINNDTLILDSVHTTWSDVRKCHFTTFAPVLAVIHAFIWCWYYFLMKPVFKEEKHEGYLLVPTIHTNGIMFFILLVASSMIGSGMDIWCNSVEMDGKLGYTCAESQKLPWKIVPSARGPEVHNFYSLLLTAKISSWLMTMTTLAQSIIASLKLYRLAMVKPRKSASITSSHSSQAEVSYIGLCSQRDPDEFDSISLHDEREEENIKEEEEDDFYNSRSRTVCFKLQ